MKVEIINGILEIYPESKTEDYALDKWYDENVNGCTQQVNGKNISFNSYKKMELSLYNKLRMFLHNKRKFRFYKTDSNKDEVFSYNGQLFRYLSNSSKGSG